MTLFLLLSPSKALSLSQKTLKVINIGIANINLIYFKGAFERKSPRGFSRDNPAPV